MPLLQWEALVSQERTEAVVLRGVDFSETSRIVTLLTPDRGRFACIAKGARRKSSPLAAVLDTLNRVEIVFYWRDGREVQQLGEATLLDGFAPIKHHLEKSTYAAFPLEVASKVAHENEPSQHLYATLVRGFERLANWPGDVQAHACWQVIQLLSVAGFEPALDACALCGGAISEMPGFSYEGGVTCPACRNDRRLTKEEYACLVALARARETCPSTKDVKEVYRALCGYAVRQLETDFRSTRVIDQMFR
jgi:DNA repair protein RecO (recombination protein O)